jgi:hypothetical protein
VGAEGVRDPKMLKRSAISASSPGEMDEPESTCRSFRTARRRRKLTGADVVDPRGA